MPKTLMPYPHLSYGFRIILQLNTHFIARYLILALCVNSRWNGQLLGSFWSRVKTSRNVETSQRRDVPNSRRRVNKKRKSTSGQRRDASTSQRQCEFCLNLIKSKGTRNQGGIGKRMD